MHYVCQPFHRELGLGWTSGQLGQVINFNFAELLLRSNTPT